MLREVKMPQPKLYRNRAEQQAAYRQRIKRAQEQISRQKGLPTLPAIPTMPGTARWRAAIECALALVIQTVDEMQDYHADRSEQWQESPQADDLQERIDTLQAIVDQIKEVTMST